MPIEEIDKTELHDKGFAQILVEAIDRAGLKGLKNKRGNILHPLCAFRYNDGSHSMVTYTVMILPKTEVSRFEAQTNLKEWCYYYPITQGISDISIPDLSLKERMYLNEQLFSEPPEKIHMRMPFKLDASRELSLTALKHTLSIIVGIQILLGRLSNSQIPDKLFSNDELSCLDSPPCRSSF
jgi:hypothetical protein